MTSTPPPNHSAPAGEPAPGGSDDGLATALRAAVAEVEEYVDDAGWDAPRQLFALVPTAELLAHEPGLIGHVTAAADSPGASAAASAPEFTPVEQGSLPGETVAAALATIAWPDEIAGAVLVLEIGVEGGNGPAEGRLAVGVMRGRPGGMCALRWRHAPEGPVTFGPELAPELIEALHATFEP